MADIAIPPAVMGLASMGAKVATVLFQFALEVGSAGKEARMMAKEISSFCSVLTFLGSVLSRAETFHTLHCLEITQEMNQRCLDIFTDILDHLNILRPPILKHVNGGVQFVARVKWVFNKPKILLLRTSIESYKNTLSLLIATVELSQKVDRRR
jgi:hypothetical protein